MPRGTELKCRAAAPVRIPAWFTDGKRYLANPGGYSGPSARESWLDVYDDDGLMHRFTTRPRRHVANEHPIAFAWVIFEKPEKLARAEREFEHATRLANELSDSRLADGEDEVVAVAFIAAAKGCVRPLVLTDDPVAWRRKLKRHDPFARVEHLARRRRVMELSLSGFPEATYISRMRKLFVKRNGVYAPITREHFDFLYQAKPSRKGTE